MNRYVFLHRIKGPVMIVVFGITALLNEWHILDYGQSWPLYLIVFGALQLAERAAWAQAHQEQEAYAWQTQARGPWAGPAPTPPPAPTPSYALTISPHDGERR